MEKQVVKIDYKILRLKDLKETPGNPQKMTDEQFRGLISSMKKDGWILDAPVIWHRPDGSHQIISGHHRVRAGIEAGILETGCKVIDGISEEKVLLKVIEANQRKGDLDADSLNIFIENLSENYDLSIDEIYNEIGIYDEINISEESKEDDYEPTGKEINTKIKNGDMIEIGNHRLVCGDSTKKEIFNILMNGEKADIVFTDPPYGVGIGSKNAFLNTFQKAGMCLDEIENDLLSPEQLKVMLVPAFINLKNNCKDDCTYFVTAPQGGELGMMMMMMMKDAGLPVRHALMWYKNSPTFSMGRLDYDYQHEPILLTWTKKHNYYGKGKHRTSVWKIDKPRKCDLHPTMKPIELISNALLNNSKYGDICLDIFAGSGSSMVACEQLKRKCYAVEISPQYCQVIINRMKEGFPDLEIKINGIDINGK